ncbi:MAG: hypothetical protein ACC618_00775 [Patescibacteria group bacterium]
MKARKTEYICYKTFRVVNIFAAVVMAFSGVSVVSNSLRLKKRSFSYD